MLKRLISFFRPAPQAAVQLAPVETPTKLKNKQQTIPSLFTSATPNPESALPRKDRGLANLDISTYRTASDTRKVVRDFASSTPDMAAAVFAYIRVGITGKYTVVAKNPDGTFNRDGTQLAQSLLNRFDVLQDYEDGFSGINSMRSNSESLAKELLFCGACSLELVLGKDRLPRTLQPVSVPQIEFYPDKSGKFLRPKQKVGGVTVDLDIPTFFYTALDQDLLDAYASSPLEPAIQPTIASNDFLNDLRRVTKKAVHPRSIVKIDEEKFRKFCPPEVLNDTEKLTAHMNAVIADVESRINGLNPEDILVLFDTLGIELLNNGNSSISREWEVMNGMLDAKVSTGVKALPSILGHGSGSQNVASSETLLFMKNVEGAIQLKLNEIYSRAMTLAVRLFGLDVVVEFKYDPIDLRPTSELEAFFAMRQERTLELLSLGFITDDEAALILTGSLTPAGFKPLSGTGFHEPKAVDPGNPTSNTGAGQSKAPDTPTSKKGPAVRQVK